MTITTNNHATTTTFLTAATVTMAVVMSLLTGTAEAANNNNIILEGTQVPSHRLVRISYCAGQVLSGDHRFMTTSVRSKLECAGQCKTHSNCLSIVYETDTKLCHLGNAMAFHNCSNMEAGGSTTVFYQEPPPCGLNEVVGPSGHCICGPRYHGSPCERYTNDCSDLRLNGVWTDESQGVHTIKPLNGPPEGVKVYCRLIKSTTVRTIFMNRKHKEESFNRTFQEYRNGFGNASYDFWIGLQNLHLITSDRDYKMIVNMKTRTNANTDLIVTTREYFNFRVTDEASGYRLLFNASMVNATDCLLPNHGVKFSARDRDRDESPSVDCAEKRKGGFWYRGNLCSDCNPHGILYQPSNTLRLDTEDEVYWTEAVGNKAIERIQMYLISTDPVSSRR